MGDRIAFLNIKQGSVALTETRYENEDTQTTYLGGITMATIYTQAVAGVVAFTFNGRSSGTATQTFVVNGDVVMKATFL